MTPRELAEAYLDRFCAGDVDGLASNGCECDPSPGDDLPDPEAVFARVRERIARDDADVEFTAPQAVTLG